MAHFFLIEPEVAGGLGAHTVIDRSVHPPVVQRLHFQLDGWLGDVVLESFPVFIVTEDVKRALLQIGATGVSFGGVEVTITDQFQQLYPDRRLPAFVWLKPEGKAGHDDIAVAADGRLIISQRVLDLLQALGLSHALVEPLSN